MSLYFSSHALTFLPKHRYNRANTKLVFNKLCTNDNISRYDELKLAVLIDADNVPYSNVKG
jgi:hypothetical protein